jgi:hypothetical protein
MNYDQCMSNAGNMYTNIAWAYGTERRFYAINSEKNLMAYIGEFQAEEQKRHSASYDYYTRCIVVILIERPKYYLT